MPVLTSRTRPKPPTELIDAVPGPLEWRRVLREAVEAELLSVEIEPDAFGIVPALVLRTIVHDWALGVLTLEELAAHTEYHLALSLLAFATEHSRTSLQERMNRAEQTLRVLRNARAQSA
jgi:hypothetical protein